MDIFWNHTLYFVLIDNVKSNINSFFFVSIFTNLEFHPFLCDIIKSALGLFNSHIIPLSMFLSIVYCSFVYYHIVHCPLQHVNKIFLFIGSDGG